MDDYYALVSVYSVDDRCFRYDVVQPHMMVWFLGSMLHEDLKGLGSSSKTDEDADLEKFLLEYSYPYLSIIGIGYDSDKFQGQYVLGNGKYSEINGKALLDYFWEESVKTAITAFRSEEI